jgi:hypothetical protein
MEQTVCEAIDWEIVEKDGKEWLKNFKYSKISNKTKCCLCSQSKKGYTGVIESVLKRHLINDHASAGKELNLSYKKSGSDGDGTPGKKAKNLILTRGQYIKDCVMIAVIKMVSFSFFDFANFRNIAAIHSENSSTIVNAKNIVKYVNSTAANIREKIAGEVKNKLVSIKLDIASRMNRSVLGVNVQFFCQSRKKIIVRTLGIIELRRSHTAVYLKSELKQILNTFSIDLRNIYTFTSDNGANMICLGKLLRSNQHDMMLTDEILQLRAETEDVQSESDDEEEEETNFDEQESTIASEVVSQIFQDKNDGFIAFLTVVRCAAHTLQLAVYDVLKVLLFRSKIQKIRSCVKELRSSAYLDFITPGVNTIKLNNVTRWNSTYKMFQSILNKKDELQKMYSNKQMSEKLLDKILISEEDFDFIESFVSSMDPVYRSTLQLEREQLAASKKA